MLVLLYLVIGLIIAVINIMGLWADQAEREIVGRIGFAIGLLVGSIFVIVAWPITLMCIAYRLLRGKVD